MLLSQAGQLVDGAAYTMALTGNLNVASASLARAHYYAHNNQMVTVFFEVVVTPTESGVTRLRMSLPIASDIISSVVFGCAAASGLIGFVQADATNDAAELVYTSPNTSGVTFRGSFSYDIR